MTQIIHFTISRGDSQYVASGQTLPIVTQGEALNKLMKNIKKAVSLHLEGENLAELGLA